MRRINEPLLPDTHRVVSIDEAYHVNSARRLEFHTVRQELEVPNTAATPLVGFAQYVEHGAIRDVQISGCLVGDIQPIVAGHPLHIIDFVLDKPLAPGERATVEYTTWFESDQTPPVQDCRRRVGSNALDHLKFAVRFDDWMYNDIWRAEWNPNLPEACKPQQATLGDFDLLSGAPDAPEVIIAQNEYFNLAPGSVVGIYWNGA